jgi:predicted metal-dependent phosphoesterase TrpH
MQPKSKISSLWTDSAAGLPYFSGVSLHSHTSFSKESLTFIHKMFAFTPGLRLLFEHYERRSHASGVTLDFERGHWCPPLQPKMAYDLEQLQIEALGLRALVSITDHDTIDAPMLLRTVPTSRHIPVSVEWTVPFGATELHLGVHNLPSAEASTWMGWLATFTAAPDEDLLCALLRELDELPGVLLVLNHPLWDLHKIGGEVHRREVLRFLSALGDCIHALELNGLRDVRENRSVVQLARETGHLLISGGDRHGLEPSSSINLSSASSFREFVEEIRVERRSHILFTEPYARRWEQRILQSTLDAVTDFPDFIEGWRRWDDRAFHPDRNGDMKPLSQLWPEGRAPLPLRAAIQFVRMGRSQHFARTFSLAFPTAPDPEAELELL